MSLHEAHGSDPSTLRRAYAAIESLQAKLAAFERRRVEPIAIVGMGCRFPGGVETPEQLWALLRDGVDAVGEVPRTRWNADALFDADPDAVGRAYSRHGGFLADVEHFDARFFGLTPREAAAMDPQQRLLLEVAWEALEDAGIAPDRLAGSRTAVLVGVMGLDYGLLQASRPVADGFGLLGGAHSIFAGRLSYTLDLKGPSLALDCACSSSLMGVHLACQSLRSGETDLALVGGVNLMLSPQPTVAMCKMRALATDGRCKTFDAAADGYVRGEGCGMVVLKRLDDARRDGDRIVAVVRGSAVNQDGRSASLTAPNGRSQVAVLREALAAAGLPPDRIGYVEAHGTGTPLGDPIEVEALASVFAASHSATRPCLLGSVKTNLGHLEAAAGMAGLMKVALALREGVVPASLHLRTLSPHIRLPEGLVPVSATQPWPASTEPRCAGVSAFAFSGTNAHVVLEQAPPEPAPEPARAAQLLVLSAATPGALDASTRRLADALRARPELRLADVAHTLQVGRSALPYRRAVLCTDVGDAVAALDAADPKRLLHGKAIRGARSVAFMFPGVGDHHAGMARELYDGEPAFRAEFDACCDRLVPLIGRDLREIVFAAGDVSPQHGADLRQMVRRAAATAARPAALDETIVAQPLVFAVELALARLWMSWGVRPDGMIGHSIGEYVAACLAGVFSLDDALAIVAGRARLIDGLPAGAMLAVSLAEADTVPRLGPGLWLSSVNAPQLCVVAGEPDAIAALAAELSKAGVTHAAVPATHAYHSQLMAPIAGELAALVAGVERRAPSIPWVSNVTGDWISAADAVSPAYWARHLLEPVRFADGVATLAADPARAFLEVGPGAALTSFCLQGGDGARTAVASLRTAYERRSDTTALLTAVARLWLSGVEVDWTAFHGPSRPGRVTLPTYPFERERHWALEAAAPSDHAGALLALEKQARMDDWFYAPVWKQAGPARAPETVAGERWLVFVDDAGLGARVASALQAGGARVVTVAHGDAFAVCGASALTLRAGRRDDYDRLVHWLADADAAPDVVVHCWSASGPPSGGRCDDATVDAALDRGWSSLVFLVQAMAATGSARPLRLCVVTEGLHDVVGGEARRPECAPILGPCLVLPLEHVEISTVAVDVALPATGADDVLATKVIAEAAAPQGDLVALRGRHRWVRAFDRIPPPEASGRSLLRDEGVYLVTGGLGGLGLAIAEELARTARARLVLIGRSGLPAREQWDGWLAGHADDDPVSERIRKVQRIEAAGGSVLALAADVADAAQMAGAVAAARARFGAIHGVVHCAGVPGAGLIALKAPEAARAVLRPKLEGTLVLDRLFAREALDFFVLFSSSFAHVPVVGQADYSAANQFLGAYAQAQAGRPDRLTLALDWGQWEWDVWPQELLRFMPDAQTLDQRLRESAGIRMDEGARAFIRLLAADRPQIVVSTQDFAQVREHARRLEVRTLLENQVTHAAAHPRPELSTPYVAPRDGFETRVAAIWQDVLGVDRVGIHDDFLELGGHSLLAMQVIARLRADLGVDVPVPRLFADPTVAGLAALAGELDGRAPLAMPEVDAGTGAALAEVAGLSDDDVDRLLGDLLPAGGLA